MSHINVFKAVLATLLMAGCQTAFSIPPAVPPVKTDGKVTVSDEASFKAALKEIVPGDVIIWKNGTYENLALKLTAEGSEGSPITLRAETPGGVVFTGLSSIQLKGSYLAAEGFAFKKLDTSVKNPILTAAKGSSCCRFSDILIDGTGSKASEIDSKWVNLYGLRHEVSNCSFIDKRNMGCLFVVWMEADIIPEHRILNNYFTRPYTHYDDNGKARNGQEAIRIGTSDFSLNPANCLVKGNHFYRCHGERAEIISNKSCGNLYEGNLFEEGDGTLTLRHGNDCIVKGNYFYSGGKSEVGGVRIIGERHTVENNVFLELTGSGYKSALCVVRGESNAALNGYWTVKDAVVKDNIFIDCRCGIVVNYSGRDSQDTPPQSVKFQGNTLVSGKSYMIPVQVIDTPSENLSWENNLIYGGSLKGVSLDKATQKPETKDYSETLSEIRDKAGKRW